MLAIHYHQTGLARQGIGLVEAEDVLYDGWSRRKARGDRLLVHGRSLEGRLLELELQLKNGELHVLTGRDLDEPERARYRRRRFAERPKIEGEPPMPKAQRRDDEDLGPRRIQTQVLGLRLDDETMRWLEEAAAREGLSASVLARIWVMERLGQEEPPGGDRQV